MYYMRFLFCYLICVEKTSYESSLEMLNNMDRVAALEGLYAVGGLRHKLNEFLRPFAQNKQIVTKQVIRRWKFLNYVTLRTTFRVPIRNA